MYLRIFPHRGMPARGSFQERVLQEMLLREQRKQIAIETYRGHLLAAGLGVRFELFQLLTENMVDEITHNNYVDATIERKKKALVVFAERHTVPKKGLARAQQYTIKSQLDLTSYSEEELAAKRDKIRARTLDNSLRHGVERQTAPKPEAPVPHKK
jgi:hypothetical protein